jgi:hypothetical protein
VEIASSSFDANFVAELAGFLVAAGGDSDHLDVSQPPNPFGVHASHETCSEYGGSQLFHLSAQTHNLSQEVGKLGEQKW